MLFFAVRELIPLYGLYAVLFRDSGISASRVSLLFVLWSVASFLFEIPSGVWADRDDPRRLLAASGGLKGLGFACWICWPSWPGFAAGFVLWALSSAMVSGTFEAYVYDSLRAAGRADHYPTLLGRAHAAAQLAVLVGIVSGGPLFVLGGYRLAGSVSVGISVATIPLARLLPPPPGVPGPDGRDGAPGYLATLRDGLTEAGHHRAVRRALLIASLAVGLTAFDEYFPLVGREHGAGDAAIPLLVAVTALGQVVGTALAGRTAHLERRVLGTMYGTGGVLLAVGAPLGSWLGFALMGVGYGLLNNVMLVTEARLQTLIRSRARATVTSVGGVGTELVALAVYAGFGAGARWWATATLFVVAVVPASAIAGLIAARLPTRPDRRAD